MSSAELFGRILAGNDVFYKHQQVGQEDLTSEQRLQVLSDLYEANKSLFVQRYEKFMLPVDCSLFDECADSIVQFVLQRIRTKSRKASQVRNRRFLKVAQLKKGGSFFSFEKMREREPYLFDVMVGKHLSEEDQLHLRPSVSHEQCPDGFGALLSQFEETSEISKRRDVHKAHWSGTEYGGGSAENVRRSRLVAHVENAMENESGSESEGEGEDTMMELREEIDRIGREEAEALENEMTGTPEQLKFEFESYMVERFLAGKDSRFFDYGTVDSDEDLDVYDVIRERDAEEKWFDED